MAFKGADFGLTAYSLLLGIKQFFQQNISFTPNDIQGKYHATLKAIFLLAILVPVQTVTFSIPANADETETISPQNDVTAKPIAQNLESAPSAQAPAQRLADLDRKIIMEYIKLARFNIQFHQEVNRHQWWRTYTYPLIREAGSSASLANTLTDLGQNARGLADPGKISRRSQKAGLKSSVVGSIISGSGSAFELAQNTWVMLRAREQGYSPADSVKYVKDWMTRTNALLSERDKLADAEESEKRRAFHDIESELFKQIRDQLLYEFRKWSVHSRETAWRENIFYAIDAMQNYTVAASSIFSIYGFNHPQIKGTAAISGLIANSAATLNPLISTGAGVLIRKYQRRQMSRDFPLNRPAMHDGILPEDIEQLKHDTEPGFGDRRALAEAAFLSNKANELDGTLTSESRKIESLRRIAQQKVVTGTVVGLARVARATIATTAYYHYSSDKVTSTRMNFAGRIPQATGQSYAIFDTGSTFVRSLLNTHKLSKQQKLPSQILAKRLADLEGLEKQMQTDHPFKM